MTWNIWMCLGDLVDNVSGHSGQDSDRLLKSQDIALQHVPSRTYTDGDILGSREEPVDKNTHERRVETELRGELSQLGIGH